MAVTSTYLEAENIIEVVFDGQLSVLEIFTGMRKSFALAKRHNTPLFLADCRTMLDEEPRILENYEIGSFMLKLAGVFLPRVKDAVILPENKIAAQNLHFFETTAQNNMIDVKVFKSREEALEWLLPVES